MAGKKKRTRRYQRGSLGLSRNKRSWVVKYYYAPGKQTTKTLGSKTQINRKRAEEMRADIVRGLNQNPDQSLADETVERFIEDVFIPMKIDSGDWRENTSKECTREIRRHVITEIGDVTWAELTPTVLRALLRKKAELGLRRHTVNHIRNYLTDICKIATAEGYPSTTSVKG